MKLPRRAGLAALFVAGVMLLGSVGMTLAAGNAQVRVLHASPNAPAVDVWLDGAKVSALTDVPFGTISNYLSVPAGSHHVQVFATGTSTNPVIDTTLDLAAGRSYTVAATNDLGHIQAQVLVDDPMPVAGKAEMRVVHFSADAPAVDVAARGAAPADALVKDLSYPNATGYAQLPGGTYNLDIRLAGTTTVALRTRPSVATDCRWWWPRTRRSRSPRPRLLPRPRLPSRPPRSALRRRRAVAPLRRCCWPSSRLPRSLPAA
jgi:hypothetical protein